MSLLVTKGMGGTYIIFSLPIIGQIKNVTINGIIQDIIMITGKIRNKTAIGILNNSTLYGKIKKVKIKGRV